MKRQKRLTTAAVVVALAGHGSLSPAGPAEARGAGEIVMRSEMVSALGDFNLKRPPILRRAIRAFGRPVSRRKIWGGGGCVVRWENAGVRAIFANFGAPPRRRGACDPRDSLLQEATATDADWWTDRGLHLGASRADLLELYAEAEYHRSTWWLTQTYLPYGDGSYVPTLAAIMRSGLVDAFYVYVGAAGD
jgi:hypothetical protein